MASSEDVGLDFHRAFQAIDTDHSGEITMEELQNYCRKMNYQETFVQKWLTLFDEDKNGRITYDEYCNTLGLLPKKEVVAKHKAQQQKSKKTSGKAGAKAARAEKVVKRRKEQEETTITTETVVADTAAKTSAEAPAESPAEVPAEVPAEAPAESPAEVPAEVPAETPAAAAAAAPAPKRSRQRQRNQPINGDCLMRYSRARMFQRKALYRLAKKSAGGGNRREAKNPSSPVAQQRPLVGGGGPTEKPIGGDKNGGTRLVSGCRSPRSLPTQVKPRRLQRRPKRSFSGHRRRLRPSIKPGSVVILLAGRHRGKRVVFLKQLASGLLLVTGPLRVNGCPLRRVCQSFVMATRTRLCLEEVRVPDRVNDQYFRRSKRLAKKMSDGADLFASQAPVYQLTHERKEDQKAVDAQVMSAVCSREDKKLMLGYLSSLFCLKSGQKPHEMLF